MSDAFDEFEQMINKMNLRELYLRRAPNTSSAR